MKKISILLIAIAMGSANSLSISIGGGTGVGISLGSGAAAAAASTKLMLDKRRDYSPMLPPNDNKISVTDDTIDDRALSHLMDHTPTSTRRK